MSLRKLLKSLANHAYLITAFGMTSVHRRRNTERSSESVDKVNPGRHGVKCIIKNHESNPCKLHGSLFLSFVRSFIPSFFLFLVPSFLHFSFPLSCFFVCCIYVYNFNIATFNELKLKLKLVETPLEEEIILMSSLIVNHGDATFHISDTIYRYTDITVPRTKRVNRFKMTTLG